jgi:hypothetical protein
MYFSLRQADGKGNATEYDDNPELLHPLAFYTRTDDPQRLRFTAPASGSYLLQVSSRDADLQASPRLQYRLRITPEQPDFRLIVMATSPRYPMAEMVQAGSAQAYTVLVWRQDGFEGPITLSMEGLPPGVQCPPQTIGAGQRQAGLVVVAGPEAKNWTGAVTVKGTAEVEGKQLVREARPASVTWAFPGQPQQQQNAPVLSRLDYSLVLAVREGAAFRVKATPDVIKAAPGDKPTINFTVDQLQSDFKGPITLSVLNLPQTVMSFNNNQPLTISDGKKGSAVLDVKAGLPPGNYTLVLLATAQVGFSKDAAAKAKTPVNIVSAVLPVTITVPAKESAGGGTLTLTPSEVTVQKGKTADIEVKLNRPPELTGDVKVEVVIPNGVAGVKGEGTVIPAGKTKGKVTVAVDATTNSGPRNLTVRMTGKVAGKADATAEAKLTVTVVRPPQ